VSLGDLNPGAASSFTPSNPFFAVNLGGTVYFPATTGSGTELWKTNGTAAGTAQVTDLNPGAATGFITGQGGAPLAVLAGNLYVAGNDGVTGAELFRSDGTGGGTNLVQDILRGTRDSFPTGLTEAGRYLFFAATTPAAGTELWRSDGTSAGTQMVTDLRPGSASSFPTDLTEINGR